MKPSLLSGFLLAALPLLFTQDARATPYVLAGDLQGNAIRKYDATSGALLGLFAGVAQPSAMQVGPDGLLYVTSNGRTSTSPNSIVPFNLETGAKLGEFAQGRFSSLTGFDFGPNGNLYAANVRSGDIVEYDGRTGEEVGVFVSGIDVPVGVRFGPDGDLYVARGHHDVSANSSVVRFDGTTGAPKGVFASDGVSDPQNLIFGPNGDLYVANSRRVQVPNSRGITRYDGTTGQRVASFNFSGLNYDPHGLAFLPNGDILMGTGQTSIQRYDAETGQSLGPFVNGGALFVTGVVYVPEPQAYALALTGLLGLLLWRRRRA